MEPPKGIVTLLFTDIEGSTEMWERLGERFRAALEEHNKIFREALKRWNGFEVKTEGDAFMIAFSSASAAVQCALEVQKKLAECQWQELLGEGAAVRVRMGMHTGEPLVGSGTGGKPDYFGPCVNRAARIAAAGHGGQVLVSSATRELATNHLPPDIMFRDLGLHWLKGLDQPERIYQVGCDENTLRDFPALKTVENRLHNLPPQLTSFVGREKDLRRVSELLAMENVRLLTLIGFGGIGKTRLAIEAASELADNFRDGVWFVDLAEAHNTQEATAAVAAALRLQPHTDRELTKQLYDFLRDKELLLILDNSEQLSQAGKMVSEILQQAPAVKCLVTSRARLSVRGETMYQLEPLSTPPEKMELEDLPHYDTITLFVERARSVNADWELTRQNAPDVVQLCRKVDGIPLAIELAASRIRSRSVQDILNELEKRLLDFQARFTNMPDRQRTLRALIDWSYELLTDEQKDFFANLAVFAGGFFGDTAEEVTDNAHAWDMTDNLVDNSLLYGREMGGSMRYYMLDVIRQYAREKLDEKPEEVAKLSRRHAEYFLRFAEERLAKARSADECEALKQIEGDLDNLRAAMDWSEENDPALCARLAATIAEFLSRRGLWQEAQERAQRGLRVTASRGEPPALLLSQLHRTLGSVLSDRGADKAAREHAEKSLEIARSVGGDDARRAEADALNLLGIIADGQGKFAEAEDFHHASLKLRRELGDRVGEAMSLHNLARVAHQKRELKNAQDLYEKALEIRREIQDRRGEAETSLNLGVLHQDEKNYAEAREHFNECLKIWEELGDRLGIGICWHNLGEVAKAEGDAKLAKDHLQQAKSIFEEIGSPNARESARLLEELERTEGHTASQ